MNKHEAMWSMIQFDHLKNKAPKSALHWIAPVLIASFRGDLDEDTDKVFKEQIKPIILELRSNMALVQYTDVNVVPKLAKVANDWLAKEKIEGLKAVICRQYFKKVFAVQLAA